MWKWKGNLKPFNSVTAMLQIWTLRYRAQVYIAGEWESSWDSLLIVHPILSALPNYQDRGTIVQLHIPYNYNNFYLLSIYYVQDSLLGALYTLLWVLKHWQTLCPLHRWGNWNESLNKAKAITARTGIGIQVCLTTKPVFLSSTMYGLHF